MGYWLPESYKWYGEACEMFDYPGLPFGKQLKELISANNTVLDLGCGIGMASLMISPWCERVIALDPDEKALRHLEENARKLGLNNIEIVCGSWPLEKPLQADVVVALHVHQIGRSAEKLKLLFEEAGKGGFITLHADQEEPFRALREALGVKPFNESCDNGCYTRGVLEALGARVTCERITYDFGQPLGTVEEAIRFIAWQTGADASREHIIKEHLDSYMTRQDGRYIVPLQRRSCGITFIK